MTGDLEFFGQFLMVSGNKDASFLRSEKRSLAWHHHGGFGAGVKYEEPREVTLWPPLSQLLALLCLPPLKERAPKPGTRSARLMQTGHAKCQGGVA